MSDLKYSKYSQYSLLQTKRDALLKFSLSDLVFMQLDPGLLLSAIMKVVLVSCKLLSALS